MATVLVEDDVIDMAKLESDLYIESDLLRGEEHLDDMTSEIF